MGRALGGVIVAQALAQAVGLDANDGIRVLIEGVAPVKNVKRDGIFLDLPAFAGKFLFAQVGK